MIGWLDAHAGLALWLVALILVAGACASFVRGARLRRRGALVRLCAALHPIRSLGDAVRVLREATEQGGAVVRLNQVELLVDGTLAQRLRDVRGLDAQGLPTPGAIEAVYEAKAAAAQLMVWLERQGMNADERRHAVQRIWKTLHDAAGNLERDIARLESPASLGRR